MEKKPTTYTLRLYGRVVPDETKVYRLNASTDSWVRELSGATTGSIVDKDEILAEMLVPAFFNAQNNYVIQLGQMDRIRQQLGGELRPQQTEIADSQIRMAVQSLQTLGISDAQIAALAKTRKARPYLQVRAPARGVILNRKVTLNQWFKAGDEFYTIADIGKVWVYADVYENEARDLKPGLRVKVMQTQMGKAFGARVGEVLPLFDPVTRTLKVRIDVDNPRYDLSLRRGHPTYGFADYLSGARELREVLLPTSLPWLRVMLAGSVTEEADHTRYGEQIASSGLLARMLEAAAERCDIVVVDTPPGLGPVTRATLAASDRVLIPLQAEPLALQTTPQILRGVQDIVSTHERLVFDGILLTMYEEGNPACETTAAYIREKVPSHLMLDIVVPRSHAVAEAFAAGQPAVVRAASDPASQAYVNLAKVGDLVLAEEFYPSLVQ